MGPISEVNTLIIVMNILFSLPLLILAVFAASAYADPSLVAMEAMPGMHPFIDELLLAAFAPADGIQRYMITSLSGLGFGNRMR